MQACRARALGPTPSLSAGRLVATNRADTRADGMATREPDPEAFAITQSGAGRIVTSRMRRSARRFAPMDGHAQSRRGRGRSAARGLVAGARPGRRPPGRCFHHRRRHRPRPVPAMAARLGAIERDRWWMPARSRNSSNVGPIAGRLRPADVPARGGGEAGRAAPAYGASV
jgi:hypothetical protein